MNAYIEPSIAKYMKTDHGMLVRDPAREVAGEMLRVDDAEEVSERDAGARPADAQHQRSDDVDRDGAAQRLAANGKSFREVVGNRRQRAEKQPLDPGEDDLRRADESRSEEAPLHVRLRGIEDRGNDARGRNDEPEPLKPRIRGRGAYGFDGHADIVRRERAPRIGVQRKVGWMQPAVPRPRTARHATDRVVTPTWSSR
jgi:hypothetical protein